MIKPDELAPSESMHTGGPGVAARVFVGQTPPI